VKVRGRHSRRFYQAADHLLRSETSADADLARRNLQAAYSEVEA